MFRNVFVIAPPKIVMLDSGTAYFALKFETSMKMGTSMPPPPIPPAAATMSPRAAKMNDKTSDLNDKKMALLKAGLGGGGGVKNKVLQFGRGMKGGGVLYLLRA